VLRLDHVVFATMDLDAAADRCLGGWGLASVPGGTHPAWGTTNRIVPLGEAYLELLAVTDPGVGRTSPIGRSILDRGEGWFAICLRDDDIDRTAQRLGLEVRPGSRVRPDGATIAWRAAGFAETRETPELPFFIAWTGPPSLLPGATPTGHPSGATAISRVEIAGDAAAFTRWVGGAELPSCTSIGRCRASSR
jgi:catechol 2,3-dioxygenase-like lactoylglutathione lyase family enzyme